MKIIEIEKGVPIPVSGAQAANGIIAQMRKMSVGDSFVYRGKSISNVHVYAKMSRIKLMTRTIDKKTGAKRCWRVA